MDTVKYISKFFLFTFIVLSSTARAECWIASDMKGFSMVDSEKFAPVSNGFSNRTIELRFDKKNSGTTGSDLQYLLWGPTSMVGLGQGPGWSTIESWTVDPVMKHVYYTKSILGNAGTSIARGIDGVTAMVGVATPCRQ